MIDPSMLEFVKGFIESHDPIGTGPAARYPFRRRFEHCVRCSVWARRLAVAEGADVEVAEVSALFHDVAKTVPDTDVNHGELGACVCEEYLTSIGCEPGKREQIVEIVRTHTAHAREPDASLEAKVESDADFLDETGAITVLWDAMVTALEGEPSYEKAHAKLARTFEQLKAGLHAKLHTKTAKQIAAGRLACIESFLANLEYELGRTDSPPPSAGLCK